MAWHILTLSMIVLRDFMWSLKGHTAKTHGKDVYVLSPKLIDGSELNLALGVYVKVVNLQRSRVARSTTSRIRASLRSSLRFRERNTLCACPCPSVATFTFLQWLWIPLLYLFPWLPYWRHRPCDLKNASEILRHCTSNEYIDPILRILSTVLILSEHKASETGLCSVFCYRQWGQRKGSNPVGPLRTWLWCSARE
jgi:hypothetical protein